MSKRGKMACKRSMTHSEQERKDGVPNNHDKKKFGHMNVQEKKKKKKNIVMTSCHSNKRREGFLQGVFYFDHPSSIFTRVHNLDQFA